MPSVFELFAITYESIIRKMPKNCLLSLHGLREEITILPRQRGITTPDLTICSSYAGRAADLGIIGASRAVSCGEFTEGSVWHV